MTGNTHVLVIGGGYAGVMAANRLTQRDDVTVTLINPRPDLVHRVRLHQLVGGSDDAVVAYEDVLAERVRLVVDSVTRIDAAERSVTLSAGGTLGYDYLIYAVGSGSAEPSVLGAAEFAYPIATLEAAQRLRAVLEATPETAPVTVVGAGPTGIETAAELAEQGRQVTLVCGGALGPYLHTRGRRSVAKRLAALGVTVVDGSDTKVTAVTGDAVRLADGRELPSEITVWTVGFGVPDLASRSGLSTDAVGRLLTDETLTGVDDARIVAAGDSAAPSGLPLRMSCLNATPLGARAADTVLSRLAGEQPENLHQSMYAQCISLGRSAGIYQFANRSDVAVRLHIDDGLGARIKEMVCTGIPKHLAGEAHKPGSFRLHRMPGGVAKRKQMLRAHRAGTPAAADRAA
ncbi:FAD-dependent oxidoreductase [Streptomyces sp. Je 1-4]|uniref:NAD(P)/FAD-dependent oxidoreductase n=1 Tax=Streptomyces TaxID=1883 RepID=UPI0021D89C8F|nr:MULTISPECIES: FAD-dependent oxidoreductase [unclassified Streptomyces]UYB39105.1 FAD-dependent oxidoreductase [Streptomyces sp. Je 1-4]UZQ35111.1 FAD-dependent oxidoreductase [Streptomyces sp. Je 1-4] [Streptomyces sp. Je 1-4 4N24]UZQ42529.1 FAD-dependent oxidoreductase [Streptomyces sp. Je 1-4] [Streptomyces sp. Je 1-4 4N24_ara]